MSEIAKMTPQEMAVILEAVVQYVVYCRRQRDRVKSGNVKAAWDIHVKQAEALELKLRQ